MLLGRQRFALAAHDLKCVDEAGAGLRRNDHGVHITTRGGHVGIVEFLLVIGDQLCTLGGLVFCSGDFFAEDDVCGVVIIELPSVGFFIISANGPSVIRVRAEGASAFEVMP